MKLVLFAALLISLWACQARDVEGEPAEAGPPDVDAGVDVVPADPAEAGTPDVDAGRGEDAGPEPVAADCGDDDPLTNVGWAGFCGDRVDDNCTNDTGDFCPADPTLNMGWSMHYFGCTSDERCAQDAGEASPEWDCSGTPPGGVVAFAKYEDAANEQVSSFCGVIYESSVVPGTFYIAVAFDLGPNPWGPDDPELGELCQPEWLMERSYFFLSDNENGLCEPIRVPSYFSREEENDPPVSANEQKLSNSCRKAVQAVYRREPTLFANDALEADFKLAMFETAEVACIGVDDFDGTPLRPASIFTIQAQAPVMLVTQ